MVCFTSLDSHTQHTKYKKRNSFCCWYAHLRSRKAMYILRFLALSKIKEGKKSSPQKKTKEQRIDPTRMEWRRVFLFCFLRNSLLLYFLISNQKRIFRNKYKMHMFPFFSASQISFVEGLFFDRKRNERTQRKKWPAQRDVQKKKK